MVLLAPLTSAFAQQRASVSGHVRDSLTNQPLAGAIVSLRGPADIQSTRTDELGAFQFSKVAAARYALVVRRLGYEPASATVDAGASAEPITIAMIRVAWLDTVRVR